MSEAAVVLIGLLVVAIGTATTAWLIFKVWNQRRRASLATKLAVAVVSASAAFGAIGTFLGLVKSFGAVGGQSIDPSQKARILAEGIAEAMNCTALALAFWVPGVIVTVVLLRTGKDRPT